MRDPEAIIEAVALEADFPVDDLLVELRGGRLFVQAKRSLNFGRPMHEVASQWMQMIRDPRFEPSKDFIAATAEHSSGPVRALAEALRRLREGAAKFSEGERHALQKLNGILRNKGAQDTELKMVLSRALVFPLLVEDEGHEHAERGRLLLDGAVVQRGEGARAWRELLLVTSEAARSRLRHPIGGWLELLRRRGVQLTVDADASRAAYLESRRNAVERYRQVLERRGSRVDLTSIGLRVPPVRLSDMDAWIAVREPEADERDNHDLFWSFRLSGRVVLTGLPGSGKSTAAARIVFEWARRDGWSLPILVSLRQVAEKDRFRKRPLRDEILNLAAELVDSADRDLVREALDDALSTGQAALFLDGLDEAADRRLNLVSDIVNLLEEVHTDTDVLLTTRDVAYADAQILKFRDLRLCRPQHADRTVKVVLQAIASHNAIADANQWVEERVEWVRQLMREDSQLGETPLVPVLLASLAANHQAEELPRTRSRILERVVRDVAAQREVKRKIRIPGDLQGHEEEVVLGAFRKIATALEGAGGSAPRADLMKPVGSYLHHEWGLAPALAVATADKLLVFWDEAGIFVGSGPTKTVSPRLQLFLEIGVALDAETKGRGEGASWVEDTAVRDNRGEILVLAAGLSPTISDALIARACRGSGAREQSLALEAARSLAEGGSASDTRVQELVKRLTSIIRRGGPEAWRATEIVTRVPVPDAEQASILDAVRECLPEEYVLVATAQASLEWGWTTDRREEALEPVLYAQRPAGLSSPRVFVDSTFTRVLVRAASNLLPSRPELAGVVAAAIERTSVGGAQELRRVLTQNGHAEIVTQHDESTRGFDFSERMARSFRQMDKDEHDVLGILTQLAPHEKLSLSQSRRLSELASLVETLNLNDLSAWLSRKWQVVRNEWIDIIATLGGFDKGVIAAQAAVVQQEQTFEPGRHSPFVDLYAFAKPAEVNRWDRVSDVDGARSLLLRILHSRRGSAIVAARALAEHPDAEGTAEAIRSVWDDLPRESVAFAVSAYLRLVGEEESQVASLADSRNENIREAVARVVALVENRRPTNVGLHLAKDRVRQVRLAVIGQMRDVTGEPREETLRLLEEMKASDDAPFTCYHCGAECEADQDSCPSCHIVTQRPSVAAGESLKRLRRKMATATE